MRATRGLASKLLHTVARYSSSGRQDWTNAMLRELDFIESDWAALFWALGSTTAIFRHSAGGLNHIGKKAAGILAGAVIAGMLVLCAFGLLRLSFRFFPALGLERMEWTHVLTGIVIPEMIFVIAAIKLWRKRGPIAAGILLSAVVLAMHFVIHVAANFH